MRYDQAVPKSLCLVRCQYFIYRRPSRKRPFADHEVFELWQLFSHLCWCPGSLDHDTWYKPRSIYEHIALASTDWCGVLIKSVTKHLYRPHSVASKLRTIKIKLVTLRRFPIVSVLLSVTWMCGIVIKLVTNLWPLPGRVQDTQHAHQISG